MGIVSGKGNPMMFYGSYPKSNRLFFYYSAYAVRALNRMFGRKEPPYVFRFYRCWGNPEVW